MTELMTADAQELRLCDTLAEYAGKLRAINERLLGGWASPTAPYSNDRMALILDQFETIRKPLERFLSVTAARLEHADGDSLIADELTLRLAEIETEFHHSLRLVHAAKTDAESSSPKRLEQIARLRVAAGLNAMKGGPLRPNA
jgi:AraC-like DNA-binding protein